jgi:hypothetical protein
MPNEIRKIYSEDIRVLRIYIISNVTTTIIYHKLYKMQEEVEAH